MNKKIIHIDMDAFYAAIEQRDNIEFRNKPIIVGGLPDRRGVVATCSYEARAYGIHSAMSSQIAYKKCPHALFIKPRFKVYQEVSNTIRDIFYKYTDLVEPLSLDEAFLDVSSSNKTATFLAEKIRSEIRIKTHLTSSAGVSYNKFLAKVASEINKPNGIFVIPPKKALSFLRNLDIGKFYGVGPKTLKKMNKLGIYKGNDLLKFSDKYLSFLFGNSGLYYYNIVRGIDKREVIPYRESKSLGKETTFITDIKVGNLSFIHNFFMKISLEIEKLLIMEKKSFKTVVLKVRYSDFVSETRSYTLDNFYYSSTVIFHIAKVLYKKFSFRVGKLRLLGISVSNFSCSNISKQLFLPLELY